MISLKALRFGSCIVGKSEEGNRPIDLTIIARIFWCQNITVTFIVIILLSL